jgi:hypothetical protein
MRAGGPRTQEAVCLPPVSLEREMGQSTGLPRRISRSKLGEGRTARAGLCPLAPIP